MGNDYLHKCTQTNQLDVVKIQGSVCIISVDMLSLYLRPRKLPRVPENLLKKRKKYQGLKAAEAKRALEEKRKVNLWIIATTVLHCCSYFPRSQLAELHISDTALSSCSLFYVGVLVKALLLSPIDLVVRGFPY